MRKYIKIDENEFKTMIEDKDLTYEDIAAHFKVSVSKIREEVRTWKKQGKLPENFTRRKGKIRKRNKREVREVKEHTCKVVHCLRCNNKKYCAEYQIVNALNDNGILIVNRSK